MYPFISETQSHSPRLLIMMLSVLSLLCLFLLLSKSALTGGSIGQSAGCIAPLSSASVWGGGLQKEGIGCRCDVRALTADEMPALLCCSSGVKKKSRLPHNGKRRSLHSRAIRSRSAESRTRWTTGPHLHLLHLLLSSVWLHLLTCIFMWRQNLPPPLLLSLLFHLHPTILTSNHTSNHPWSLDLDLELELADPFLS